MFSPLFAVDGSLNSFGTDVSWWYTAVFIPVLVPVITGLLSAVGALWVVARTNWYRKLSLWKPYSQELWLYKMRLYSRICVAAREVREAAYANVYISNSKRDDQEWARSLEKAFNERDREI